MSRLFRVLSVFCFAAVVGACGGGGGSGGVNSPSGSSGNSSSSSSSSSANAATDGLSVSQNSLNLSSPAGSGTATARLQVSYQNSNGAFLVIGSPVGQVVPDWLSVSTDGLTISVTTSATGLAVGMYSSTLRLALVDANGALLSYKDVQINFNVMTAPTPTPVLSGTPTPIPTAVSSVGWNIYSADLAPDAPAALKLADGTTATFSKKETNGTGSAAATAGLMTFDTSASSNTGTEIVDYRYGLPRTATYPKHMTLLTRLKAASVNSALRGFQIEANFADAETTEKTAASRVRLSIYGTSPSGSWQGAALEACDNGGATPLICRASASVDSYHIYQVSITLTDAKHGYVHVYVDGNDTPIIQYGSAAFPVLLRDAAGTGASYVRFGDMDSGFKHKSEIDWIIWTQDAAFVPSQLKGRLPAGIGLIDSSYQ